MEAWGLNPLDCMHSAFTLHKDLLLPLFHPYICLADGRSGNRLFYFTEEEAEALCLVSTKSLRFVGTWGVPRPSR